MCERVLKKIKKNHLPSQNLTTWVLGTDDAYTMANTRNCSSMSVVNRWWMVMMANGYVAAAHAESWVWLQRVAVTWVARLSDREFGTPSQPKATYLLALGAPGAGGAVPPRVGADGALPDVGPAAALVPRAARRAPRPRHLLGAHGAPPALVAEVDEPVGARAARGVHAPGGALRVGPARQADGRAPARERVRGARLVVRPAQAELPLGTPDARRPVVHGPGRARRAPPSAEEDVPGLALARRRAGPAVGVGEAVRARPQEGVGVGAARLRRATGALVAWFWFGKV